MTELMFYIKIKFYFYSNTQQSLFYIYQFDLYFIFQTRVIFSNFYLREKKLLEIERAKWLSVKPLTSLMLSKVTWEGKNNK